MSRCTSCGAQTEATWRFCESCGNELTPNDGAGAQTLPIASYGPEPGEAKTRRRVLLPAVLTVAILLSGVAAYLGDVFIQTSDELDSTRGDLAQTVSALESTESDLTETAESLDQTESVLAETERERDRAKRQVRSLKTSLEGVRGSLGAAEEQVALQAGQIDVLRRCLAGVATALDLVLYEDYIGAGNALQNVEAACNEAASLV